MLGILLGNLKELPKPVGKYLVGITQLDFTDKSRKKVFPFEWELQVILMEEQLLLRLV